MTGYFCSYPGCTEEAHYVGPRCEKHRLGTLQADEFVNLCARLRALGATEVSVSDYSAKFAPITGSAVVPVQGQRREPEKPMTPEQANAERRRRELGE